MKAMPCHPNKPVPKFANEDEERAFWIAHDSAEIVDWRSARRMTLPKLTGSITLGRRRKSTLSKDTRGAGRPIEKS